MATTTNYGWTTPNDTDLVKDGAAAIRTLGSSIDTTVFANASAGIAKTIVDAKGDIIAATAADTVSRLAVGANDTVLTADSSTATGLKWAAAGGGGMTLLSTTSLSGTSVTISSIAQTYNHLQIYVEDWQSSDNGGVGFLRVNSNTTSPNYRYQGIIQDNNGTGGLNGSYGTQISTVGQSATNGDQNNITVYDLLFYTSSIRKVGTYMTYYAGGGTVGTTLQSGFMAINEAAAITSITILSNASMAGTVKIYGVK